MSKPFSTSCCDFLESTRLWCSDPGLIQKTPLEAGGCWLPKERVGWQNGSLVGNIEYKGWHPAAGVQLGHTTPECMDMLGQRYGKVSIFAMITIKLSCCSPK